MQPALGMVLHVGVCIDAYAHRLMARQDTWTSSMVSPCGCRGAEGCTICCMLVVHGLTVAPDTSIRQPRSFMHMVQRKGHRLSAATYVAPGAESIAGVKASVIRDAIILVSLDLLELPSIAQKFARTSSGAQMSACAPHIRLTVRLWCSPMTCTQPWRNAASFGVSQVAQHEQTPCAG